MFRPIFTVVTVCYNAEATIERTLKSVANQSYTGIEYIVVDGASKDATLDFVQSYEHAVSTLISEPDKGLYDAMNKAIRIATGDYICFLNAGDTFFESETLTKIAKQLNGALPDLIYGDTALVDNHGEFQRMRRLSPSDKLTWKSFKQGMLVCHQAFIPKRTLVPMYDLDYKFSSDFDWCIKIMKKCTNIHNSHLILINYLNEGLTTRNHKASLKERYRIMEKYYGKCSTFFMHIWFAFRHLLKK